MHTSPKTNATGLPYLAKLMDRDKSTISWELRHNRGLRDHRPKQAHQTLRGQKACKKRYGSRERRGIIANQVSIDLRPSIVAERARFGDWEADFFFAHPYSSWERGANESMNGLIRQFFPKKMAFDCIRKQDIAHALHRLNHRPRKCLGFKTPHEVFMKQLQFHQQAFALRA